MIWSLMFSDASFCFGVGSRSVRRSYSGLLREALGAQARERFVHQRFPRRLASHPVHTLEPMWVLASDDEPFGRPVQSEAEQHAPS